MCPAVYKLFCLCVGHRSSHAIFYKLFDIKHNLFRAYCKTVRHSPLCADRVGKIMKDGASKFDVFVAVRLF